jgi:DNA-binding winged helix-turn-helix (wHTH) protein
LDQEVNIRPQDVGSGGLSAPDLVQIGDLTLDVRREELRDGTGARVELRNRSFSVLRHLVQNAGRVLSKDELLAANWPGLTVTDDSLTQCVSDIRRLLGVSGRDILRTVARRGYMIVLPERHPETARDTSAGPTVAVWPFESDTSGSLDKILQGSLARHGERRPRTWR